MVAVSRGLCEEEAVLDMWWWPDVGSRCCRLASNSWFLVCLSKLTGVSGISYEEGLKSLMIVTKSFHG